MTKYSKYRYIYSYLYTFIEFVFELMIFIYSNAICYCIFYVDLHVVVISIIMGPNYHFSIAAKSIITFLMKM